MKIIFRWNFFVIAASALSIAALFWSVDLTAGGRPGGEAAGNNLSFPVIWSDGVTKALRGTPGGENIKLDGAMWYWWGTDADGNPEACLADPDNTDWCDDGIAGEPKGNAPCNDRTDVHCMAVFRQQDSNSDWQAESADWSDAAVYVTWIDWGDNLESVDWYTRSKVRVEVVLLQDLTTPMLQYGMRHLSGWGIDELWGLATDGVSWDPNPDDGTDETVYWTAPEVAKPDYMEGDEYGYQATVYSGCARLTIQKLVSPREDIGELSWDPTIGEWTGEDVRSSILNKVVWDSDDGPGYYSAEINVKGKVIYGYTWDVKNLNDKTGEPLTAAGDYRITFSLDEANCPVTLNTFFDEAQILAPADEVTAVAEEGEEPGGGAAGVIDVTNNLTYIDVRILEPSSGKDKVKK